MLAITLRHLVADDGVVATSKTGRELQVHGRVIDLVDLDGHDFLQLLHLLLHLHGLRGLVAETLDEVLHLGDFLLLVLVGPQLLFAALLAQHDVLIIFYAIIDNPSARDFQRTVRHIIYKGTVVADEHHCPTPLCEQLLQPLNGLNVEVVCRLVEQQHVGSPEQNLGQLNTHAPAAGELPCGALKVGTQESQTHERPLQLGLLTLSTRHEQPLMLVGVAFHESHILLALVVGALTHLTLQPLYAILQLCRIGEGFLCLLAHGRGVLQVHHLRQVTYGGVLCRGNGAARWVLQATQYLQQGTLSRPVLAHQGDAVAVVDDEASLGKERLNAELHL